MSCDSATAPINIVKSISSKCDLKCSVKFNYDVTSIRAENKGDYVRLAFDPQTIPPVLFNAQKYIVQEARIYQPSLHTFGGQHMAAEMVITHQNQTSNQNLLVCVPISNGGGASSSLDVIIKQVTQKANTKGSSTNITGSTFSLKQIVPNKPFYNYAGTLPYPPCNGTYEYIVFDKTNAQMISDNTWNNLTKIITPSVYSTHNPVGGLFYNDIGPSSLADGDDIYIECNPTGDDGSILIGVPKVISTGGNAWEQITNSGMLIVIISIAVFALIITLFKIVVNKITESE